MNSQLSQRSETRLALSEATQAWMLAHRYDSANLNYQGDNGHTALIQATKEGNIEVVQELLNAGADINIRNYDGNNALWFACFGNHLDLVTLLLESQINIDNLNDNGATVLMYAASAGKTEVLQLLIDAGANRELKNLDDFKAIDFASTIDAFRMLKNAAN